MTSSFNIHVDNNLTFSNDADATLSVAAVSGTDTVGKNITISGGQGTGTGAGGSLIFQTADGAGSTGSSANALATAMTILDNGYVGIGTDSPAYPLDISGHSTTQSPSGTVWGYYLATGGVGVVGSPWNTYNHNVSCKATGEFIGSQFTTYSDSRIKKNIVELIDDEALLKFRQLKPCKYNYIDTLNRGEDTVYGFIAQEVKEVADYAVKILTTGEFIPNVYQSAIYNDTVITFQELHNLTTNGNIKLNLPSNTDITCPYTVVDTLTLNIDISNLPSDDIPSNDFQYAEDGTQLTYNIFVYGTEVNDFHVLDKNTIWTTTASALQEIDRIQQDAIIQINAEKAKTTTLETQVADLLARMTALENP